jgi:folate-binding Fe-S cluster repair protein YgfZ
MIIQGMTAPLDGVAPLPHLGVIRAQGEEAAKFLHGQLTQDFSLLGSSEARLAAFCNPKGRMMASFIGFKRSPTEVWLICSRDVLPATLKRLSMFVLRTKAKLSDATADVALYGLAGSSAPGGAPWAKTDQGAATVVQLYPADGQPRSLWAAPAS